jgi:hypothetical protein
VDLLFSPFSPHVTAFYSAALVENGHGLVRRPDLDLHEERAMILALWTVCCGIHERNEKRNRRDRDRDRERDMIAHDGEGGWGREKRR